MKIKGVASTGLVPIKALCILLGHRAGEVFGAIPSVAIAAIQAGDAEFVDPPEDVETFDVELPVPGGKAEPVRAKAKQSEKDAAAAKIDIPDDWESMVGIAKIAKAKAINGGEAPANLEAAIAIIKAELDRRKAAA